MSFATIFHEIMNAIPAIGTIGMSIYVWRASRERVKTARIDSITKRLSNHAVKINDHETRIICIEKDFRQVPGQQSLDKLSGRIDSLNSTLSTTKGRLDGVNRAVDLINEFLINHGGGIK